MRCPDEFYSNCLNASRKCSSCKAGSSPSAALLYVPVREDSPLITDHPQYGKDQRAYSNKKRGMGNERKVARKLNSNSSVRAKATAGSGSVRGDGDLTIDISSSNGGGFSFNIEAKHRGKLNRWYVTRDEYEKGRRQGVEVYAITAQSAKGFDETMYMMDERTFQSFLSLIDCNTQQVPND